MQKCIRNIKRFGKSKVLCITCKMYERCLFNQKTKVIK